MELSSLLTVSGMPCVALHEPDQEIAALYRSDFPIVLLRPSGETLEMRDERLGTVLSYLPQGVIAVIVPPLQTDAQDRRLRTWCESVQTDAPVITHTRDLPLALATLAARARRSAEMNAQLMLRLAEMRSVHEELQNSYDALRAYISEGGLVPPRVGFNNLPDPDGANLPEEVTEVMQPIPIELRSLCGISLHLNTEVPHFSEGRLLVELLAADDDEVRFTWQTKYSAVRRGWTTFAFEQNGRFLRKSPILRLRYETAIGYGPLFSLGRPQLRRDKAAMINGEAGVRSLAFKAWKSVPGAPLSLSNQMWPVVRIDSRPITQIELTIDDTLSISDLLRLEDTLDFKPIVLLAQRNRILVHPLKNETTIARIFEACPPGTATVIADVETDNELAGLIEYALAVLPPEDAQTVCDGRSLPEAAQVSDWITLPPETEGTVHLSIDRPLIRASDLYLMTRLPAGHSPDFGWAHFKQIRLKGQFS